MLFSLSMKTLFAALLLCIPTLVWGQIVDEKFNKLASAAQELTLTQQGWNIVCGEDPTKGTCQEDKQQIDFLTTIWIAEAKNFKAIGAPDDCAVGLRDRIIALQTGVFQWNLQYQAVKVTDEQKATGLREQEKLKADETQILKDIDDCKNNRNTGIFQQGVKTIKI